VVTRLLLDSHVYLWWLTDTPMSAHATQAIRDADEIFVSVATAWELAIKVGVGKLRMERPIAEVLADNGFVELPILLHHVEALASLPNHHRDPFDRLLAAQALAEGLTLVTRDPQLARYPVSVLRA
jgi:PIN domain nuclease of toxin-antitoxin system